MSPSIPRRSRGSVVPVAFGLSLLLVGSLFLVPAVSGAGTSSPAWTSTAESWSNGVVLCAFGPSAPQVTVSAPDLPSTGLTGTIDAVTEVGSLGAVAAANFSAGTWTGVNRSTDDYYDMTFTGTVPIRATSGGASVGTATVQVDFFLPAYSGTSLGGTNDVTMVVALSQWSWQGAGDHLTLRMPLAPAFPQNEHLEAGGPPGALMTSVSTQSGQELEYVSDQSIANGSGAAGAATPISTVPAATVTATHAELTISFGTEAGNFRSLNFSTQLGIPLPATIAGIPTIDFVVVGSVAVLASLGMAAGVRVVRQRPSDLEYVDEGP